MRACKPDVITAVSDIPFTPPPYSQKRIMKSLERSTAWLAELLRREVASHEDNGSGQCNVLVPLAGSHDVRARRAFSEGLVEPLYGKDAELVAPLRTLDEGVSGYVLDLVPLKMSLTGTESSHISEATVKLFQESLAPLPPQKLRVVHSPESPHEVLRLIRDVGIDLLDAPWAQRAADLGVALDFRFPVMEAVPAAGQPCSPPLYRNNGKRDIGHNLFSNSYAHDHSRLASLFLDAASWSQVPNHEETRDLVCPCAACSPLTRQEYIVHSAADTFRPAESPEPNPPFIRSYLHHLLHTHEMSSHALLVMHNLTVVDRFFAGIRRTLTEPEGEARFRKEVERFHDRYDEQLTVFDEARAQWAKVEKERGKGRLAREKGAKVIPEVDKE
jgi:hypothetical protein